MYRHMRPCVLSLATSLFLLILMHVFPTYIVIFSLSATKPSISFFSFIWTLFLLCTTFSAFNSCDQIGNYMSEQMQTSQPCRVQPVRSAEPRAPCQKPNLLVWQEIFFSFHWCNSQLDTETKTPLTYPRGPCLILYSHRICVQGLFYYLLMCDSLETAGRW